MNVENILNEYEVQKQNKFKSIEVEKLIDIEYDLGNLYVFDKNTSNEKTLKSNKDAYLINLTRDNVQILATKLWELPSERVEDTIIVKLPDPIIRLPREKPLPSEKKKTKWERFATMKGIQRKKKGRMTWDDELKQWVPRWGYKRTNDDTKDWLIEVPDNADPYEDQFEKKIKAKKERVDKNELQRLRNISRNSKGKVTGVGIMPQKAPSDKDDIRRQLLAAQKSTASMGKFDAKIPKEKPMKQERKRKFETNFGNLKEEKERSLKILKQLNSSQPLVDTNKAANLAIAAKESQNAQRNKEILEKRANKTPKKQRGTSKHSKQKRARPN